MARATTKTGARLLETRAEYDEAVAEIEQLLNGNPAPGSREIARVEFLSLLVEHYDRKHFELPGGDAAPRDVVAFMLEQKGMTRSDLAVVIGGRSRVSEFLSGKRALSTTQIVALRDLLGISADLLIEATPPARSGMRGTKVSVARAAKSTRGLAAKKHGKRAKP